MREIKITPEDVGRSFLTNGDVVYKITEYNHLQYVETLTFWGEIVEDRNINKTKKRKLNFVDSHGFSENGGKFYDFKEWLDDKNKSGDKD